MLFEDIPSLACSLAAVVCLAHGCRELCLPAGEARLLASALGRRRDPASVYRGPWPALQCRRCGSISMTRETWLELVVEICELPTFASAASASLSAYCRHQASQSVSRSEECASGRPRLTWCKASCRSHVQHHQSLNRWPGVDYFASQGAPLMGSRSSLALHSGLPLIGLGNFEHLRIVQIHLAGAFDRSKFSGPPRKQKVLLLHYSYKY